MSDGTEDNPPTIPRAAGGRARPRPPALLRRYRREATLVTVLGLITASALLVYVFGGIIEAHFHWSGAPAVFILAMALTSIASWRVNEALWRVARRGEQRLVEAQALAGVGSWEWDVGPDRVVWTDEMFRLLGLRPDEVYPAYEAFLARVDPGDRDDVDRRLRGAVKEQSSFSIDVRILLPAGGQRWVHARGEVGDGDGEGPRLRGTLHDVSERKTAEEALRRSEERFRRIVETAQEGVWTLSATGVTTFVNARMAGMLGCDSEAMVGRPFLEFVDVSNQDSARHHLAPFRPGTDDHFDLKLRRSDGATLWALVSVTRLTDGGSFTGTLAMVTDITDRKRAEQLLAHQALHDPLTGLPNRTLLLDRLRQALARSERTDAAVGVLFLDLDRFKVVNDTLGHGAGDDLLVQVAARLRTAVRPMDTVARFGGDEFAVLCEGIAGEAGARALADRIAAALGAPVAVGGRDVAVSASIGIALAGGDTQDPEAVLRDADAAMYRAKERGRDCQEVFDVAMRTRLLERLGTEEALRGALEQDEFRLHYQPEVSLRDGRITGVEALIRWQHPERGLIGPGDFLSVAEETGLIVPMGTWVLQEACRQVRAWRDANPTIGDVTVWVNLSTRQLAQPDVVDVVADVLERTGLDAACLGIEITESTFMDVRMVGPVLQALKKLGVCLAVDDFGTGFSSMNYLKEFPVDILKVDRSFVAGLGRDAGDSAIVAAVIGLAHSLGLQAIAEGVETYQHLAGLHGLGCDRAQGYYFSTPVPPEAMERQLAASRAASLVAGSETAPRAGAPATPARVGAG
ncbi:MAG TPA: EAL domain-containing protein, partial [Acidimicrobiia bacterium]|nr:EAL domain-containing protein [Acidimicrobiia bacterium]